MSDPEEPSEPITFEVPEVLAGERIDRVIATVTGWSRADVQGLVAEGLVTVDGTTVAKSRRVDAGALIEVTGEPRPDQPPEPEPVDLVIRYEDDEVVVVAKPAGLVVHPGAGHEHGTMVHGLLARYPGIAAVGDRFRPGIVHRLDRDTSGLVMVARTPRAYEALVAQLSERSVERRYQALVWGHLSSPRGLIDAPIGRSQTRRTRMAVRTSGREARTGYEVVRTFAEPECSMLECRLETGRTHQIRVHLAAIGHPVVGDATYGGSRQSLVLDRPFLHAGSLGFVHPASGEAMRFEEPLPDALRTVLERLEAANP